MTRPRETPGEPGSRGSRRWRPVGHAAAAIAATALTVANIAAGSAALLASTAATLDASGQPTGSPFNGYWPVGALFLRSNGHLGHHFCTASVVHSPAGDLLLTAAHCVQGLSLKPAGGVVFAPGYHRGRMPLGLWVVTGEFVTSDWAANHDPNQDFAFLVVRDQTDPIERRSGAERLGTGTQLPTQVQVVGYPDATNTPIRCSAKARAFTIHALHQMKFVCGGYTDGTSGGPFLLHVNTKTGAGLIIGVIGGYQEGGNTPAISYSPLFGTAIAALYRTATAPSPSPTPTPTPTTSPAAGASPAPSPDP